jgi:ATP-dependent Clp protease ATP-binding subunit ClpB
MGLLRRVPSNRNNQFNFLLEVSFDAYAAHLAALTLTEHSPATGEEEPKDGFGKLPHRLVNIQAKLNDLRTILSSHDVSSAAIYGDKGSGKSSLIEAFLRAHAEKKLSSGTLAKPVFLFDSNKFFVEIARENWVTQFDACLQNVAERGGIVVFDNFDDFVHTADGEAGRLVNCLISHLEHRDGLQAIYGAQLSKKAELEAVSSGITRQFKPVELVKEPSIEELKPMLLAHVPVLEEFYNVNFTEEAVDEIIRLLVRYPGRAFPGPRPANAIAFADKVGAFVKISKYAEPLENAQMEERMGLIRDELVLLDWDESAKATERRAVLQKELGELKVKLDVAKKEYADKFASLLKAQQELAKVSGKVAELRGKKNRNAGEDQSFSTLEAAEKTARTKLALMEKGLYPKPPSVRATHVRSIFNAEAGIAIRSEEERLKRLDELTPYLASQIFLQDDPRNALADGYINREYGVSDPTRPAGVYIFAGGTGLGKTELVKALARFDVGVEKRAELGDNVKPIIVNMNNFASAASVSSLTGSARGLVGYGEVIPWLEEVKKNPRAILLLDEADKAHPNIFDALMQVMDTGELVDSTGATISFKDVIIVIAMNGITDAELTQEELISDEALRSRLLKVPSAAEEARGQPLFKAPFIARVNYVGVFSHLEDEQMVRIFREQELRKINRDYRDKKITLTADDETMKDILHAFNVAGNGGRGPRQVSSKYVRPVMTRYLLERDRKALADGTYGEMPEQKVKLTFDPSTRTIGVVPLDDKPNPPGAVQRPVPQEEPKMAA